MKSQAIGLITALLLAGSVGMSIGCSRNPSAVQGDPNEPQLHPTISSDETAMASVNAIGLPALSRIEIAKADDPRDEGWITEAFTAEAMSQLKKLGNQVLGHASENGNSTPPNFKPPISELFSSDTLVPTELETVFDDMRFRIRRRTKNAKSDSHTRSRMTYETAIRPLQDWLSKTSLDRRFKFKLFRISIDDQDPTRATTQQYVQFSGRSSQQSRELNATWIVEWEQHDGSPRIRSIRVDEFEEVVANVDRLFVDCTQSVLSGNESYRTALVPGISHWRTRLEQQMAVYNFGHHGLATGDVNGDGLEDLYVCQTGGLPNHLFVQRDDGTLVETSATAGVDYLDNTRSALFLDIDNDDDQDLVVALTTGLLLFENNGSGTFQIRARIPSVRQAFSLAAADYDRDGLLDLYFCVYYGNSKEVSELPVPVPYFDAKNGGENFLIRNDGNWKFTNVTKQVGLDEGNQRFSFAAVWEDFDVDGDPDLLVVNDFGPNQLYENRDGSFRDVAQTSGLMDGAFGMSATFGDYDRDGLMDLYVSNMFSAAGNRVTFQPQFKATLNEPTKARFQHLARGNSLFRRTNDGRFEDVSVTQGVTMGRWSWGSLFADINNDGWDDLLVANGYVTGDSKDDL